MRWGLSSLRAPGRADRSRRSRRRSYAARPRHRHCPGNPACAFSTSKSGSGRAPATRRASQSSTSYERKPGQIRAVAVAADAGRQTRTPHCGRAPARSRHRYRLCRAGSAVAARDRARAARPSLHLWRRDSHSSRRTSSPWPTRCAAVPTVLMALAPGREDTTPSSDAMRPAPIRQAGDDATPYLKNYKSLVRSLPDLARPGRELERLRRSRMTTASCDASLSPSAMTERSFRALRWKSCA